MADVVLDASAVLAWLRGEPGGERVVEALPDALVSAVNLSEVVSKLLDRGAAEDSALAAVASLPFSVVDFDESAALDTGALRGRTRSFGLSLGDRACLALAARQRLPVLTADRAWNGLDIGVEIRLIR